MSDEDEEQTSSKANHFHEMNHRHLSTIRGKLQELTREKAKYNVEKLIQDADFVQSEIVHLSHAIAELNKEINTQIAMKKTLNTKIAMLRSNSSLRYTNSKMALRDRELYEKELEKPNKNDRYRELAREKIQSICDALPQLEKQDEYNQSLKQAEETQIIAQNKREKLQESLNAKSRRQTEIRQLLNDSSTRLPELETAIENLRLERTQIFDLLNKKKSSRRSAAIPEKPFQSPVPSFASLERETFEHEKQQSNDQLEKIAVLLKYFHEKISEHNLTLQDQTNDEQAMSTSMMEEKESSTTRTLRSSLSMENHPENFYEYKKELPTDIVDKYAGTQQKKQQNSQTKKNKRNKKNLGLKHPSQMVSLYNDVRTSTGSLDTLPYMPLFESELSSTIKSLQILEQSIQSYLNELSQRQFTYSNDENQSQILDDDEDIRDSALDTFSETSSLVEPINPFKDARSIAPQLMNIPEARSSSSSDDKKTIASSASPPSSHRSDPKTAQQAALDLPIEISPLTAQIAQIERQVSDEGYRSVRNEQQQHTTATSSHSTTYDCTEKVDKWLSTTSIAIDNRNETTHFQAADADPEENPLEPAIPVFNP